jgi:serine/threonine-protein kinase RsbW
VSETVRLTIPAKAEYLVLARLVLTGIAMEVPMSEIALADLKLAVTEVCGNAVQHAYQEDPGVVRVVFRVDAEAIEVSVEDEGAPGVAFPDVDDDSVLLDGLAESGMGLAIVRAVMDKVAIDEDPAARGTVVRMRKQLVA